MPFPILQEAFCSPRVFIPHPKAAALIVGVGSALSICNNEIIPQHFNSVCFLPPILT